MLWFLITLIPPAVWSITNYIDKFLLSRYFKSNGVGGLMIFSSGVGFILLPFIFLLKPQVITEFNVSFLLISFNSLFFLIALLFYLYALHSEDTTIVIPLLQMIPIFSFVLGYIFLGETLNFLQIAGSILIIISAIFLSINIENLSKIKFKFRTFILVSFSSFFYALNFLFFKKFSLESDFLTTSFWEYLGFSFFAICIILFNRNYRNNFFEVIKTNSTKVISINILNEFLGIIAKSALNFASLLAPITLTWVMNGFQPAFILVYGLFLAYFFPKLYKENFSKRILVQKFVAVFLIIVGTVIINL